MFFLFFNAGQACCFFSPLQVRHFKRVLSSAMSRRTLTLLTRFKNSVLLVVCGRETGVFWLFCVQRLLSHLHFSSGLIAQHILTLRG